MVEVIDMRVTAIMAGPSSQKIPAMMMPMVRTNEETERI
jgi:hypothetical protein